MLNHWPGGWYNPKFDMMLSDQSWPDLWSDTLFDGLHILVQPSDIQSVFSLPRNYSFHSIEIATQHLESFHFNLHFVTNSMKLQEVFGKIAYWTNLDFFDTNIGLYGQTI